MPQALHLPQRALNQIYYYTAAIPAFRRWRQEDEKFKGILGYILSSRVPGLYEILFHKKNRRWAKEPVGPEGKQGRRREEEEERGRERREEEEEEEKFLTVSQNLEPTGAYAG